MSVFNKRQPRHNLQAWNQSVTTYLFEANLKADSGHGTECTVTLSPSHARCTGPAPRSQERPQLTMSSPLNELSTIVLEQMCKKGCNVLLWREGL